MRDKMCALWKDQITVEKNQIWYRSHDIEKIVVDDADDIETSDMKIDGQGCRFEVGT
jgi:hypothetical protein